MLQAYGDPYLDANTHAALQVPPVYIILTLVGVWGHRGGNMVPINKRLVFSLNFSVCVFGKLES